LGNPELGAEGADELGEHRLFAQVAVHLRETGEELLDGYRARRHAYPAFEIARETDLHAVHLQARLYFPDLVGGNADVIVVPRTEGFVKTYGGDPINLGGTSPSRGLGRAGRPGYRPRKSRRPSRGRGGCAPTIGCGGWIC